VDRREWVEQLSGMTGLLCADGFDDAIIGVTYPSPGRQSVVMYDARKCVQILVERDGMSAEEAWEFFEFNTLGAWVGERTPLFMEMPSVEMFA